MKSDKTRELVILSLYAALIIVSVQFIRIPFGPQFVHLGNALVVIAVLIFGARKGALVATVGLGLFDIFNGYAAEVWITILESLIVCFVLYLVFEKLLKSNDKMMNIIIVGVIAAVTKIILNFVKYTIINSVVAAIPLNAAMALALPKIGGTFGTSVVTILQFRSCILSSNVFYRNIKDLAGLSCFFFLIFQKQRSKFSLKNGKIVKLMSRKERAESRFSPDILCLF